MVAAVWLSSRPILKEPLRRCTSTHPRTLPHRPYRCQAVGPIENHDERNQRAPDPANKSDNHERDQEEPQDDSREKTTRARSPGGGGRRGRSVGSLIDLRAQQVTATKVRMERRLHSMIQGGEGTMIRRNILSQLPSAPLGCFRGAFSLRFLYGHFSRGYHYTPLAYILLLAKCVVGRIM